MPAFKLKKEAKNAIFLGGMCALSYLAVYIARNMLTATTTQIREVGAFSDNLLGNLASIYFITYACGQLINGIVGDKIKAKYMISFGLMLAGVCNAIFSTVTGNTLGAMISYGSSGFFLSMIYGPMTKVVAENTEPLYTTRCSVAYTFASLIGTPIAGFVAVLVAWQVAFRISAAALITMGIITLLAFNLLEKKGIIRYGHFKVQKAAAANPIKTLIKRDIIKFTFISTITGVVRTAVVFWLPTYLEQHLGFSPDNSTMLFTLCTSILSVTSFVAVFSYEMLKRNMELAIFIYFTVATTAFVGVLFVTDPVLNIILMLLALLGNHCADSLMWSRYCPSLRDTGLTSSATGFLDFISYMAASIASSVFPNLRDIIGWSGLILVWMGLMAFGILISIPRKKAAN